MRGRKTLRDGHDDAHRLGPGQPAAVDQLLPQRPTLEELEHHHELPVDLAGRQAAHHVGVLQLREDLHLVEEEPATFFRAGQLGPQHLERHPSLREALLRLVDLAHPTFADQSTDDVLPDALRVLKGFHCVLALVRARRAHDSEPPVSAGDSHSRTASRRSTAAAMHVLHSEGHLGRKLVGAKEANLPYFQGIHGRLRGLVDVALHDHRDRVKAWIPVRPGEDAHEAARDAARDAGLLGDLANHGFPQGLAPLERPARERPLPRVAAPDQQPAPVARAACRADADDGAPEHVTRHVFDEDPHGARDAKGRHWGRYDRSAFHEARHVPYRRPRSRRHPRRRRRARPGRRLHVARAPRGSPLRRRPRPRALRQGRPWLHRERGRGSPGGRRHPGGLEQEGSAAGFRRAHPVARPARRHAARAPAPSALDARRLRLPPARRDRRAATAAWR